jgi:hypothetical protein
MNRKFYLILFCLITTFAGRAQIGGETTYQFLELTNSARIAALGGTQVALTDTGDLNLPFHNPALLHEGMNNNFLVNYVNYLADINYGYVSYAPQINLKGNLAFGMNYINYGEFKEATETGELTGNYFKAAEYALHIIYSDSYKRLRYGVNIKPVYSVFESYQSFGLAADLGITYSSKDSLTNVALVARNIGGQFTTYYADGNREAIPFNLQAGISSKLRHAPVVFSLTMQHLTHWDLAWDESEEEQTLETWYVRQESFAKQIMRHAVLGVEILPSDNFILRAGYNYQRRQELKYDEKLSTVGFSMGFGVKVKRFRLDFATSRFHLAGSSNLFSLAINLNERF